MLQELVNEIFRTGQMKNPFVDFDICKVQSGKQDELNADRFIRRINYNLFSIIHSIIEMDKIEKKVPQMYVNERTNDCFVMQAHHESLLTRFKIIMRYSHWLFERCTKIELKSHQEIKELFELTNQLSEDEKTFLRIEWYDLISLALKWLDHDGRVKCFIENSTIKFQIDGEERSFLVHKNPRIFLHTEVPGIFDSPAANIHSKTYFSICFLNLIKYLEVLSKYCCIYHHSKTYYESYLKKHNDENAFRTLEIEPAENTLGIISVLSSIQNISGTYFNIAKFTM